MTNANPIRKKIASVGLAAAVLAAAAMPLAVAGAEPSAGTSAAKITAAKFKKLKQRVAQLEARGNGPNGPAGGDLTGEYPNPQIGPDAVGTDEVASDSLTELDIADGAINNGELATGSVGADELLGNIVGNSALKPVISRVSAGEVSNNTFVEETASCGAGEIMLGGGYAWTADASVDMVASAPGGAPGSENTSWFVRGRSPGTGNALFAWVTCLAL
jgi:hypothetical protein